MTDAAHSFIVEDADREISPAAAMDLFQAFRRLDELLDTARAIAERAYEASSKDPYRSFYVSPEDFRSLLQRPVGQPLLFAGPFGPAESPGPLGRMKGRFGLSDFDLDALLVACAPEIDLRYQRLYAYLQDDVSRKRPTVDLVLNLLCADAFSKVEARRRFWPDAPLVAGRLVELSGGESEPALARELRVDEAVVAAIAGHCRLDDRIRSFSRFHPLEDVGSASEPGDDAARLAHVALAPRTNARGRIFHLQARHGAADELAARMALTLGQPLLVADVRLAVAAGVDLLAALPILLRDAHMQDAVLYLKDADALRSQEHRGQLGLVLSGLERAAALTIVSADAPWEALADGARVAANVVSTVAPLPDFEQRRACWRLSLNGGGCDVADADLEAISARFRLTLAQIRSAVESARSRAELRSARHDGAQPTVTAQDLYAAARAQSTHNLTSLARKIEPRRSWDDLVLPEDSLAQLRELCSQVRFHHRVYGAWGFDRKLSLGKGISVLFSGPPGAGKTMGAEVLGAELGLDLFKIDLSQVVSKYIGETEKNLNRVFEEARASNAILFFDEADALFGKRSEVRDSHDRYANIEIAYLLQQMEEYEGLSVLATNLKKNLDEAFTRRLSFIIDFPFPDEQSRLRIWQTVWPPELPLGSDLDLAYMAKRYRVAGGSIKNIAVAAAFLAVEDDDPVKTHHLVRAARRELQKMGKSSSAPNESAAGGAR